MDSLIVPLHLQIPLKSKCTLKAQVQANSVCEQCRNLELERLGSLALEWDELPEPWIGSVEMQREAAQVPLGNGPVTWTSMGTWRRSRAKDACYLCRLFDPSAYDGDDHHVLVRLRARIDGTWMGPTQKLWQLVLERRLPDVLRPLAFWPSHHTIVCMLRTDQTKFALPAIAYPLSARADLQAARSSLERCQQTHPDCEDESIFIVSSLIDCASLDVIDPPENSKYAALSYRWGKESCSPIGMKSKKRYPDTIMDAATVCLQLGIPFLWVDRYCLHKRDPVRAQEIASMHHIYRRAEVTIIATAGSGAHYGLPGIGDTARIYSPVINIGNIELFRDLSRTVDPPSEWMTRAWTLQESYLSRRRLIFTDYRCVFECAQCVHREGETPENDPETMSAGFYGRHTIGRHRTEERILHLYELLLQQYTARELTYPSDSLNAFLGILQFLRILPVSIEAVWGLPFVANTRTIPKQNRGPNDLAMARALCWTHRTHRPSKAIARRTSFPSWSWCGWAGHYKPWTEDLDNSSLHSKLEIMFECGDTDLLTTAQLVPLIQRYPLQYDRPKAIRVRAFALPLACIRSWSQHPHAQHAAEEGLLPYIERNFYALDNNIGVDVIAFSPRVMGIKLPANIMKKRRRRLVMLCSELGKVHGLVLQRYGSSAPFERIGHFEICDFRTSGSDKLLDEVVEKTGSELTWSVIV